MTTAIIEIVRQQQRVRERTVGTIHRHVSEIHGKMHNVRGLSAMKLLLFGMLVSSSVGPMIIGVVVDSESLIEFGCSMAGGTLGAIIFLCLPTTECFDSRKMARIAVANLAAAVALGPSASWFVSRAIGIEINVPMLVAVSCVLGFTASALIQAARPIWLKAWDSWNTRKANEISGGDQK